MSNPTISVANLLISPSSPILLVKKARRLRKETGDNRYHAPLEDEGQMTIFRRLRHIMARCFIVFVQEPMLIAVTIYMSVS